MRILWLSHLIPHPPKGGVLQRAYNMVRELGRYHAVDLLAFQQENLMGPLVKDLAEGEADARSALSQFCDYVEFFSIESNRGPLGDYWLAARSLLTRDPYNMNWLKSKRFAEAIRERLLAVDYDIVHFDTISLAVYLDAIGDVPAVLDHHNIESHMLLRRARNESGILRSWYMRQEGTRLKDIETRLCPRFALNITCSELDSERLNEFCPQAKCEVVPNGVDTSFFVPGEGRSTERSLIFVGTLNWYPNVEAVRFIANEIWPRLRDADSTVSVDIVGAHPPDDIVAVGRADSRFRVHGFVDEMLPMLDAAGVYVCPIRDGGGTKLKILDALSMSKAIIADPIACEGIDVTDGKDVIFASTPDAYVAEILRVLDDQELRARLGGNARKLAQEKYDYAAIGKQLAGLFEELV